MVDTLFLVFIQDSVSFATLINVSFSSWMLKARQHISAQLLHSAFFLSIHGLTEISDKNWCGKFSLSF